MAQPLRALAALTGNAIEFTVPSIHVASTRNSSSRGSATLFHISKHQACTQVHIRTHGQAFIHIKLINIKKSKCLTGAVGCSQKPLLRWLTPVGPLLQEGGREGCRGGCTGGRLGLGVWKGGLGTGLGMLPECKMWEAWVG